MGLLPGAEPLGLLSPHAPATPLCQPCLIEVASGILGQFLPDTAQSRLSVCYRRLLPGSKGISFRMLQLLPPVSFLRDNSPLGSPLPKKVSMITMEKSNPHPGTFCCVTNKRNASDFYGTFLFLYIFFSFIGIQHSLQGTGECIVFLPILQIEKLRSKRFD